MVPSPDAIGPGRSEEEKRFTESYGKLLDVLVKIEKLPEAIDGLRTREIKGVLLDTRGTRDSVQQYVHFLVKNDSNKLDALGVYDGRIDAYEVSSLPEGKVSIDWGGRAGKANYCFYEMSSMKFGSQDGILSLGPNTMGDLFKDAVLLFPSPEESTVMITARGLLTKSLFSLMNEGDSQTVGLLADALKAAYGIKDDETAGSAGVK